MNKMIPVEESFAEWRKDPNYVEAYDALESDPNLKSRLNDRKFHPGLVLIATLK